MGCNAFNPLAVTAMETFNFIRVMETRLANGSSRLGTEARRVG